MVDRENDREKLSTNKKSSIWLLQIHTTQQQRIQQVGITPNTNRIVYYPECSEYSN